MIFNMTGGGGNPLNFQVKTYPSETELKADKPKENTIGVITNTTMTSWVFSANEPKEPEVGMVWILVGKSSVTEFNAIKSKTLMVYPLSVKQYEGGKFVDNVAYIYQNDKWASLTTAPTNGLIAEYTFDELSGNSILDTSPNGYNLTLKNVTQESGVVGKAGSFSGSGYASANVRVVPDGMSGFSGLTVSFFVKSQQRSDPCAMLHQYNNYYGFSIGIEDGIPYASTGDDWLNIGDNKTTDGQWHHICIVFNYSTSVCQGWLDGKKVSSASCSKFTTSAANFTVGRHSMKDIDYFTGSLDQIRLYNRALSDDEVATLWNGGVGC